MAICSMAFSALGSHVRSSSTADRANERHIMLRYYDFSENISTNAFHAHLLSPSHVPSSHAHTRSMSIAPAHGATTGAHRPSALSRWRCAAVSVAPEASKSRGARLRSALRREALKGAWTRCLRPRMHRIEREPTSHMTWHTHDPARKSRGGKRAKERKG